MFACEKDELSDHHIRCLNSNQVCNGKPQCPHGDDEGKKEKYFIFLPPSVFFNVGQICEEKKCASSSCEQHCLETTKGDYF